MTEFNWTENTKTLYDAYLKAAPPGFKTVTEKGLMTALTQAVGEGGDVTEADFVKAVKDRTPAPFRSTGYGAIRPHLTDPSLLDK